MGIRVPSCQGWAGLRGRAPVFPSSSTGQSEGSRLALALPRPQSGLLPLTAERQLQRGGPGWVSGTWQQLQPNGREAERGFILPAIPELTSYTTQDKGHTGE